ncbi:hypothetical protein [Protaetiibacter sp. SSC-01]|uniref:hypothetical protein n=1 Tax=Protaetiibacter sp. SSC-01 TaxID=2759943 RepID=UPI00223B82B6|nr:hypothetical protein [Protaetiibacter sp. SSC-01]
MTNISNQMPVPPILPGRDGDPETDGADLDPTVVEVDGEEKLDPDANPDEVDSAEADRLASGGE